MSLLPPPEINSISIKQIGDYTLGEEIGSGAFGKVVLGKHILTEEKVAIKILDKMILNQTPEDYELVKQEISILKLVKHKYIVQLYEIMQTAQHIFIIMEYCEGKEILDYILTKNRLSELESLKYFQQLINCLFYLHSQNIAHRDVKIDNMLLDKNKDLKLIDFGLSTKYTDDSLLDQPCGTVVYAAPEVLEGKEYHGMLADVWSSGIVLFGMLSGYLPFSDKDDEVNKQHVIKGEINLPDFLSDMAKDLLKHMLDIDPMTRYTLQEIKDHPWFNMTECILIPGIIIDYNIIPVDEKILNLCVTFNKNKEEVYNSVRNNKHDSNSSLYYLIIKQLKRKGVKSVSDLCSDEFIDFILDEKNLVHPELVQENNDNENNDRKNEEILIDNLNENNMEKNKEKEEKEEKEEKVEKEEKEEKEEMVEKEEKKEMEEIVENEEMEMEIKDIYEKSLQIHEDIKDNGKDKKIMGESNVNGLLENTKDKERNKEDENKNNGNEELTNKKILLSDVINESYSQKSIENDPDNNDMNNNTSNKNNDLEEKISKNNSLEKNQNNNNIIDNIPKNIEEKDSINGNITKTPEKKEKENKSIIDEERKIIEEGENLENEEEEIIDSLNKNSTEKKYKEINKRNIFEEMIIEEESQNNKENKDINELENNSGDEKLNKNIENNNEKIKEKNKIKSIEINIENIIENDLFKKSNTNKEEQKNENEVHEESKIIKKTEESIQDNKDNKYKKIINQEIDLTSIMDEMKSKTQINLRNNNMNNIENVIKKYNNNVNDIEVIDIKINKNEKYLNLKNENKRYHKTNDKIIKSNNIQSKKKFNKKRQIYKTTKKKLYSIEKSNNVLKTLKRSQVKSNNNITSNPRISHGTEIKSNKNRSVFKMPNCQNINSNNNFSSKNENIKKESLKYINYSTRNSNKKKLVFTKSKPDSELEKNNNINVNTKKNHSNLKKKTSNQIYSIINIINKNNFVSTSTDFKLKSFIHNSSLNKKSSKKVNKTNLQSKFDEMANEKNKEKKDEIDYNDVYLSLNKKYSNSKCNIHSTTNKSKYNTSKKHYLNNYTSLLTQNKNNGFNNINTINNNIIKSIICLDSEDKNNIQKINNLKNKKSAQKSLKNYKKSLSNNLNKNNITNKEQITNKDEEKNKMIKNNSKRLESSVIVNRYKSPLAVRELSESPKQRYLNMKTRYARIPWKVKKKGIDERLESNLVYKNYINKITNPFKQNNSKIVIYEKYKKKNSIGRKNNYSKRKLNSTLWTTNIKQIKLINNKNNKISYKMNNSSSRAKIKKSKERFSSDVLNSNNQNDNNNIISNNTVYTPNKKRNISINDNNSNLKISNINTLYSTNLYLSNNKINENKIKNGIDNVANCMKKTTESQVIKDAGYFTNNKIRHKHSNSVSSMQSINLKNRLTLYNDNKNNIYTPIDLSCLFIKYKNINEYANYLKNKFKKNNISYIQKKSNVFICNKNDINYDIEIIKMNKNCKCFELKTKSGNVTESDNKNIFYLKIYGRKERYKINELFKSFVFNLD